MSEYIDDLAIKASECQGDFWVKFGEALAICGGDPAHMFHEPQMFKAILDAEESLTGVRRTTVTRESYADMPLKSVVRILAQNGIRMVFHPKWHITPECWIPPGSLITTERTQ